MRRLGIKVGNARINAGGFYGGTALTIEDHVFISYNVFFDCSDEITIERNARIGMQVTFITSSHQLGASDQRAAEARSAPIRVGRGAWIGGRATILPGASIGDGAVIAAGAVVAGDCEPNGLYGGVPARLLRHLDA